MFANGSFNLYLQGLDLSTFHYTCDNVGTRDISMIHDIKEHNGYDYIRRSSFINKVDPRGTKGEPRGAKGSQGEPRRAKGNQGEPGGTNYNQF